MSILKKIYRKAKAGPKKIVLPEGEEDRVIQAACKAQREGLAKPVLLGDKDRIQKKARKLSLKVESVEISRTFTIPALLVVLVDTRNERDRPFVLLSRFALISAELMIIRVSG